MIKHYKKYLPAVLLVGMIGMTGLAWSADQPAGAPEGAAPSGDKSDKEVVIKGESRLKVKTEKPEPDLKFDVDEIAVPYVVTEDYVQDVSPTAIAHPNSSITAYLSSSQTASPFIQIFKRPPLLSMRPKFKSRGNIAQWRLRITDGMGNVFKDFSGKGSLPDEIVWDGRSGGAKSAAPQGEMADVGTSYSYIFTVIDEASNPVSQMGRPIILESLLYEQDGMTIAKITTESLFEKKDRRTVLSRKGELYCSELADILLAKQKYPLLIESYAKDIDAANSNAEMVRDYMAERYIVPKEKFKILGYQSRLEKIVFKINN